MRNIFRKIIFAVSRAAGFIALGLLAIILAAVIVMESPWFKNRFRELLVQQANKVIAGELSVGRLSGNLFTGIALHDVRVVSADSEILAIDRFDARYRLLPLIFRQVRIRSIVLSEPRVAIKRNADGVWNVAVLFKKSAKSPQKKPASAPAWSFSVRRFMVRKGTVSVDTGSPENNITLNDLEMNIGGNVKAGKAVTAKLNIRDITAIIPEKKIALRHLSAVARWEGNKGTLEKYEFITERSSVTASGSYEKGDVPRLSAAIRFSISADELASATGRRFRGGMIGGEVSAEGYIRSIAFEQRASWQGMSVESEGNLDAVMPSVTMKLRARSIYPARLGLLPEKYKGDVINADGEIMVRGTKLSTMDASIMLSAADSRMKNTVMNNASFHGDLHQGIIISSASLNMPAGIIAVAASGTVSGLAEPEKPVDLFVTGKARRVNLSAVSGKVPGSDINASLTARVSRDAGSRKPFNVGSQVTIESSSIKGIAIYPSRIAGTYRAPAVTIQEAKIESELGQIRFDGMAEIPGTVSARYAVQADALDRLKKLLPGVPLKGSANVAGTLSGSLQHPAVTVNMEGKEIEISSVTIAAVSLEAMVNDIRKAESGPASLAVRASEITFGDSRMNEVVLDAQRSTSTVEIVLNVVRDGSSGASIAGSATTKGTMLKNIRIGRFEVHKGTVTWRNRSPADARSTPQGWELTPFIIFSKEQQISVSGATRGEALDYTVRCDSVNVAEIGRLAGLTMPLEGILLGAVTLSGTVSSPVATGRFVLNNESAALYPFSRLTLSAAYSDESAQASMELENKGETLLTAEGDLPVQLSLDPFKAEVLPEGMFVQIKTSRLSPSMFTSFTHGVKKADGDIRADLTVSGTPREPSVNGHITVDSGTLSLVSTGVEYSGITARISIVDGSLNLDRLILRGGDGTAEVKGKAVLYGGGLEQFDLTAAFKKFTLAETPDMEGTVDGKLRWQGSLFDHDVTGSMTLLNGHYTIPETAKKKVEEVEIIEDSGSSAVVGEGSKGEKQSLFDGMNMDATLNVPGNFWLRGRGINAELKGDLEFRKSIDSGIRIAGTVQTVRGTFVFRQRTLNITEGTVVFSGSARVDAFLNIRAEGRISGVTIIVLVGGTISKPEINLQSDPAMDQSDILSYLIFGRPANKLSQTEGSVLQKTTASVVSDIAIKGLRNVLGSELTPDVIDVNPGGEGGVGVGKYLNDRLFVKYEWNIGPENLSQTTVEYEINPSFNLRSQMGNEQTSGLDLLWRYNY